MSQFVMWYDSREGGSPVLNNVAGSLIGVLDACLVTGFNNKTISSLVVAGGVATATCAAHGFMGKYSQDIEISGASVPALNGRFQPTVVDANTFTFLAPSVSNQTVSGTITAKRPSLGWSKPFSNADTAIYQRTNPQATSMLLRVSEPAGSVSAKVLMLESATGVNTFVDPSPTPSQWAGGLDWLKSWPNATPKPWQIVGDGKSFYLFIQPDNPTPYPRAINLEKPYAFAFGDLISFKQVDAYNAFIVGMTGDIYSTGTNAGHDQTIGGSGNAFSSIFPSSCIARAADQINKSMFFGFKTPANEYSGSENNGTPFPSTVDNGLMLMPGMAVYEAGQARAANFQYRGVMPGTIYVPAAKPYQHTTILPNVVNLAGRSVIMMAYMKPPNTGCQIAIDLTGPWS